MGSFVSGLSGPLGASLQSAPLVPEPTLLAEVFFLFLFFSAGHFDCLSCELLNQINC